MRLSDWRSVAPHANSVSDKVIATIEPVLMGLGAEQDPPCWIAWATTRRPATRSSHSRTRARPVQRSGDGPPGGTAGCRQADSLEPCPGRRAGRRAAGRPHRRQLPGGGPAPPRRRRRGRPGDRVRARRLRRTRRAAVSVPRRRASVIRGTVTPLRLVSDADRPELPGADVHPVRRTIRYWLVRAAIWMATRALFRIEFAVAGIFPRDPRSTASIT